MHTHTNYSSIHTYTHKYTHIIIYTIQHLLPVAPSGEEQVVEGQAPGGGPRLLLPPAERRADHRVVRQVPYLV